MKKLLMMVLSLNCLVFQSYAGQIADCSYAGDSQNPAEQIQVFRNGSDNAASAISIHLKSGNVDATLQAVEVTPEDGGQALGIRYGRGGFLTLLIHNGHSDNDRSGVALGMTHPETCDANF